MINKDKKGGAGEFDDDGFEPDEFMDADFDEAGFDEEAEYSEAEGEEFADEDFDSEEWQEEAEAPGKKTKKQKSLLTGGEKKGMSVNTMVIIGAVVLGAGVMFFNIMSQSQKVESQKQTVFQSALNIGSIMDGKLFGDKPAEQTPEEAAATEQKAEEGFLVNPESTLSPNTPPQPAPIAPEEASEPLTPLPEQIAAPSAEAPRGPDDTITPTQNAATDVVPVVPLDTPEEAQSVEPTPVAENTSAQDILSQAIANRAKEAEEPAQETAAPVAPTEEVAEAPVVETPAVETPAPVVPVAEAPAVVAAPPVVDTSEIQKAAVEAASQEVQGLEEKIDRMLERMEQIESDLGSVKATSNGGNEEIEETIQSLKKEIADLRARPVAPAPSRTPPKEEVSETKTDSSPAVAPAKKVAPPKPIVAAKPAPSNWELRAAQPGRAWVSPQGSRDMQSVVVGDTLPGIGRVTGIVFQGNQWTVIGTQGQIRQ